MKLGRQSYYYKERAAIRHYANQPEPSDSLRFKLYVVCRYDRSKESWCLVFSPGPVLCGHQC